MLNSIRIERFKSIDDETFPLGRISVLIGPNNAGKSSVLQAIQFAVSVAQSLRLDNVAQWEGERLSGTLSSQQLIYSPLRDVHALAAGGSLKQSEAKAIKITFTTDDQGTTVVSARRGKNKNISVTVDGSKLGMRLEKLEEPFSAVAPGLAGIPAYEEFRSPGIVRRGAARGDANAVFRNILWLLRSEAPAWQSFVQNIRRVFPSLDIEVYFDQSSDEHIEAYVIRGEDEELPIDSCGTGVLQAIQVLGYIDVYKPKLLILDEPDSHLHPNNQRSLMVLLAELAQQRDFQVLISSHSRHMLDESLQLGARIHWLSGGKIVPDHADRAKTLLELGALDCWDRLRNGRTAFVIFTEDDDPLPLKKILASSGMDLDDCEIWSYSGCTNITTAKVLAQFIRDHAPNTTIIVHKDRDYMAQTDAAQFEQEIASLGAYSFLTAGTDIESHFLDVNHLATVAPTVDLARIGELVQEAISLEEENSIKVFINERLASARRSRLPGAPMANEGEIVLEVQKIYKADPLRYCRGKKVLGRVKALLQSELKHNIDPLRSTPALSSVVLHGIASQHAPASN